MQKIRSTYIQEVSTIHPELIVNVHFLYEANVHDDEDETVEVDSVIHVDDYGGTKLNIDPKKPSIDRFLAHIREDARVKAYKQRKQNQVTK